jgi:hypothetical protein
LWQALVVREKPSPLLAPSAMRSPPPWALERPGSGAQAPRASWRQAYRLSAMWERGRPSCEWPGPDVALSQIPAPESLYRYDSSFSTRAGLTLKLESRHGPLSPQQRRIALGALRGVHFNSQAADGYTASRSARGDITVFRNQGASFAYTQLPLIRTGRLARQVILLGHAATEKLSSAPARRATAQSLVHCVSVSGFRIESWHAHSGSQLWSTVLPRVRKRGRRSKVHTKILGQFGRNFLAVWGTGLAACTIDLNTGKILWQYYRDDQFCGLSLLTPEAGPLVGWDESMHFRIWPMTDAKTSELPRSRFPFTVRPVRTRWEGEPTKLGKYVQDVRADTTTPGRLIATVDEASARRLGSRTLTISGWGTSVFLPEGAIDERYEISDL